MDITLEKTRSIRGTLKVPGDKSIAHRALIFGAMAQGEQTVEGLPASQDVASTASCLRALGTSIESDPEDSVKVSTQTWVQEGKLDAGNSGTTARLLSGLIAGLGMPCTIDGDESLRKRPMSRIAEPLTQMGTHIDMSPGGHLPMLIQGGDLFGITYHPPVASAQVKSAILIAGLYALGKTSVVERSMTRDHTENLLSAMGIPVEREKDKISVSGGAQPKGIHVKVPGDISSAMFFIAAALLLPDSEILLPHTGINPTRTGALRVLETMGAEIELENVDTHNNERVADIIVRSNPLRCAEIEGPIIPFLIDELPILAVVATQAEGVTKVRGAQELRYKESDRIHGIVQNLTKLGANVTELEDGFLVHGPCPLKGNRVSSYGDHRIAMAMAVAGLVAEGETIIEESDVVRISYPEFFQDLSSLTS